MHMNIPFVTKCKYANMYKYIYLFIYIHMYIYIYMGRQAGIVGDICEVEQTPRVASWLRHHLLNDDSRFWSQAKP